MSTSNDSPTPRDPDIRRFADRDTLTHDVAEHVLARLGDAVEQRGAAHLALTGGTLGIEIVAALVARAQDLPDEAWEGVRLWWGDERFVATGDADRNVDQARDAGLDRLPVPPAQVHVMPASTGADAGDAADDAAAAARAHAGEYESAGRPPFDVLLLGVGPDAHVASLFPDRPELDSADDVVAVHDSPKPPPTRLTFTLPVLRAAREVAFVVAGSDKATAVAAARGRRDDPSVPASCVRGTVATTWWVDEDAASRLPV